MSKVLISSALRGRCAERDGISAYFSYASVGGIRLRKFSITGNLRESSGGSLGIGKLTNDKTFLYSGNTFGGNFATKFDSNCAAVSQYEPPILTSSLTDSVPFYMGGNLFLATSYHPGQDNLFCWDGNSTNLIWSTDTGVRGRSMYMDFMGNIYIGTNYVNNKNLLKYNNDGNFIESVEITNQINPLLAISIWGHNLATGVLFRVTGQDLKYNVAFENNQPTSTIFAITHDSDRNIYVGRLNGSVKKYSPTGVNLGQYNGTGQVSQLVVKRGIVFVAQIRAGNITNYAISDNMTDLLWTYDHGSNCFGVTVF